MLNVLRVALVALAALSTTLFSSPATAGMVATPKASTEQKAETEVAILRAAAGKAGLDVAAVAPSLEKLPAGVREAAVAHVLSLESAGNALGIVAIIAGVVIVGAAVISEMIWDKGFLTSYQQ